MQLSRALDDKTFDIRLRDKLVSDGKIDKEKVESYLNSLPDDAANAVYTDEVNSQKESEETTTEPQI